MFSIVITINIKIVSVKLLEYKRPVVILFLNTVYQ